MMHIKASKNNLKKGILVSQNYYEDSIGIVMSDPYEFNRSAHLGTEKKWSHGFIEIYWIKHEHSKIVAKNIEHMIDDLLIIKDN